MPQTAPHPLRVDEAIAWARLPLTEARRLLITVLGSSTTTAFLITHPEHTLTTAQTEQFKDWVERRQQGEPLAYLIGEREFWGRPFTCRPGVLIPRPDTETLVEAALETLAPDTRGWALDCGCGSGILAVTLACERPYLNVIAIDRSPIAADITFENARRHGVENRVHVIQSSWMDALAPDAQFSLIVSNPPYIDESDPHLNQGDLRFEPREALSAPEQGHADLFHLIEHAPHYLAPGGWLWLEHGYNQGSTCQFHFDRAYWNRPEHRHDLSGWVRVTGAQRPLDTC